MLPETRPNSLVRELLWRGDRIAEGTVQHAFVRQIADGSLPEETFLWYLAQNALFLTGYAAALRHSLAVGADPPVRQALADLEGAISDSAIGRHADEYEARSGRCLDLSTTDAAPVTVKYIEHLFASAGPGVPVSILCSILPGEQSYAAAGRYYGTVGLLTSDNPYCSWIEQYASGHVDEIVAGLLSLIGRAASDTDGPGRALLETYERSARLDAQFWLMISEPARR